MKNRIILDSNIVFSALLSKNNKFKLVIYESDFELYSCNFMFVEIFKYKEKIQKQSKLPNDELLLQLQNILT